MAKIIQQLMAMREEVLYAIFIYLHKEYGDLERDRCLEILEGYSMGYHACHIFCVWWDRSWMVDCAGGYY